MELERNDVFPKIAFDLDETLGVPMIEGSQIIGWQTRPGCVDLLEELKRRFILCLWTVSNRRYVDKVLAYGLKEWFQEVYSWDELPGRWKDIRRIGAKYLVDDSPHHREEAVRQGIAYGYIVVPAYGSPEDVADPLGWATRVRRTVGMIEGLGAAPC